MCYLPLQTNRHLWTWGGACLSGRDVGEVWFGNLGRQMTQFGPPMSTQTWHLLQQSKKHADTTTYHVDLISTSRILTRVQAAPQTPRNSLSPSSFRETWDSFSTCHFQDTLGRRRALFCFRIKIFLQKKKTPAFIVN